jgi:hypothetical protein
MGKPRAEISQKEFEGLCAFQATLDEMCDYFHVTKATFERWCKDTYKETFYTVFSKKRVAGKISLRRSGFKLAQTNAAVHIFYAKNFLNMRDIPLQDSDTDTPTPVQVVINVQDSSKVINADNSNS